MKGPIVTLVDDVAPDVIKQASHLLKIKHIELRIDNGTFEQVTVGR